MVAETDCMGITPVQERRCKTAVENTCERCHDYFPAIHLEIHLISRRIYREMKRDPAARILIVCHLCHNEIHTLPVPVKKQRMIVAKRGFYIRRDLRRVLGYRPAPYHAPDSIDLAQVYEEYLGRCPQGSYRMSG
jgi:hypothetical protein